MGFNVRHRKRCERVYLLPILRCKMKKKIILISSIIFVIILIPIVLVSFAFGISPQYDKSFYGGMAIKYNRLKNISGRKVVVIGGSSLAFGLRSDLLEQELGLPVVNFGLYANLGTKYMLDVAEDFIGKDDIVIIAPEQNAQALSLYFNAEAAWYSLDGEYEILNKIDGDNAGEMLGKFFAFVSGKFGYWKNNNKPDPDGVYNVASFNSFGDIEYSRPYNTMKDGFDGATPISFDKSVIVDEFIDYLNAYGKTVKKVGARAYYTFSPMNEKALTADSNDEVILEYYKYLSESLDITVIGNPKTHILDSDWFYDSNFHLNEAGAVYYTALLAQEIKAELDDFTPITINVPDKPQVPQAPGTIGSVSADLEEAAKIFNLSGVEISTSGEEVIFRGEWTVDGLTEYGKTLTEIVIPDTLTGLPVTKISSGSFAGNTTVTKITFGENIVAVGEKAFDGCTALVGIYMTSLEPDNFHVASNLIQGADNCYVYVPEQAYIAYKFDYFWSFLDANRPLRPY